MEIGSPRVIASARRIEFPLLILVSCREQQEAESKQRADQ